jgi:glycine dehydrogenase subunit 2
MARAQYVAAEGVSSELANDLGVHARSSTLGLPEVSELEVVRHYTNLSSKNFAIDKQFYPLGSCTMKYNPRGAHAVASIPGFLKRHPLAPLANSQGYLSCAYELQNYLKDVTGMQAVSLTPMAGAQGEFAGVAMIRAYHQKRGDHERVEILVPEAAHGTNPATAVMCGFVVREIPVTKEGDVDLEALKAAVGPRTAGLMMTNPSTCGVFERQIQEIAETVHEAGGLLYYDGANLNAILGKVRPGDMGFDVLHMNLHKTFATPHGGGGPGSGPVGVGARLAPFLPTPTVGMDEDGTYRWLDQKDIPDTIGRLSSFMGNAGILLRAYCLCSLARRRGHESGGGIRNAQCELSGEVFGESGLRAWLILRAVRPMNSLSPSRAKPSTNTSRQWILQNACWTMVIMPQRPTFRYWSPSVC